MCKINIKLLSAVFLLTAVHNGNAGWLDLVNKTAKEATNTGSTAIAKSALSSSEVVKGLKEALASGVESAINNLGKPGGFSDNKLVEITIPESLQSVASTARTLGQESMLIPLK